MATLKRLKTLLLGLAVIIITFTIFIALPAQLPSCSSLSCDKLIWACTKRGIPPIHYHTLIWDEPTWPCWETPMGRLPILPLAGKLLVEEEPDNKEEITVSGYLLYASFEGTEMRVLSPKGGLPNRTIKLSILSYYEENSEVENLILTTDMDGFFNTDIEFEEIPECYTVVAEYEGETIPPQRPVVTYFECSAIYTTCEGVGWEEEPGIPWWVWLVTGLAVLIGGFLFYWYIRRRRGRPTVKIPEADIETPAKSETPETQEEVVEFTSGDTLRIEISFPQINDPFPDVWGTGEPLTVLFRLKDNEGKIIPSQSGEINWGDGETAQSVADGEGQIQLEHTFNIKGEYIISASYLDRDTSRKISSRRKIRVVDYREEMVRLFNEMVGTLNIKDINIDRKMTAREIEVLLVERLKEVSGQTIRKIVAGFEEANYSLHPVARSSYETMYLAVSEVFKNAG